MYFSKYSFNEKIIVPLKLIIILLLHIRGEPCLNPGSASQFVFEEGDVAIVLAQEVYI